MKQNSIVSIDTSLGSSSALNRQIGLSRSLGMCSSSYAKLNMQSLMERSSLYHTNRREKAPRTRACVYTSACNKV
jgi:hypothetical protein